MSADKPNAAPGPPEQLRSLGKYQISGRLGAGGMGAVFLATDIELRRPVALKVLPKDRAENPTLVKRFRAEAQAVAQLRHNNIVAIYEAGEIQGYPYLALELVEGQDLQSIIEKRGPMPPKRSLKIIRQVTEALAHAAERNIVHRDIKPSNLLVQVDGTCKITDFGLARTVDDTLDTSITRAGTTVGTVDYISPEQAVDSKAADIRSDIYSLGCTWYHMLTGQPPYPDGSMQNKLHGHISSPIPNPRSLNPNVPEAYVAVLHQMMAKRPQDRYQTPADLLDDLDRVAGAVNQINAELFDEPVSGAESDATLASEDAPPGTGQESSPARRQSRSPDDPPAKRGKASSRTEPAPEESEAAPSRINPKLKGRGSETGRRAARGRSDAVDGAAAEAASPEEGTRPRQLPPRKQSGAGAFAIDVDLGRIALIGLVVACAVGLFWWALSRGTSWSTSTISAIGEGEPPAPNVDAVVVNPHEPQEQNPDAPRAPQGAPAAVAKVELPHRTPGASLVLLAADPQDVTRQGESFPGLDDAGGHETPLAREFLPDWVYAVRNAPTEGLTKVVVESPPRAGSVGTIEAAIHQSPARERVIELKGNGPFPLRPTVVQGCQRLILRAAEGSEPIILLQGNPDDTKGEGYLHLSGGVLELNGLHVLAQTVVTGQPRTLLSVTGGTIVLRNCSVTIPEEAGPTIAVRVTASAGFDFPSRVLLERCLIRGRLATAVDCRGPRADVVIGGSLLANESSPLVSAEVVAAAAPPASEPPAAPAGNPAPPAGHASEAAAGPSASAGSTALFVRVLGSVLWTNGEALRLSQPASLSIQRGVVQLRRSILASAGGDTATLLGLPAWPGRSTSLSGQPRVAGLMWRQERSWLAGWPTLVRLGETSAASEGEWQSFWAAPLETASLTSAPLNRSAELTRFAVADLARWSDRVPAEVAAGSHVGLAQPPPVPRQVLLDRLLLLASRPQLPDSHVKLPPAAAPLQFNLRSLKQDLNELLNSAEVPDGSHVQLSGQGLVQIPPLQFRNRSLRLEFLQAGEGAPLTLRPQAKPGNVPEAAIVVEGGRLDLIGARIQATPSRSRESAPRLLLVRDGEFTLRNCHLEGGPAAQETDAGLVEWVQSQRGGPRRFAYITDTQLSGQQPLLVADVDQRLLVLDNNLLASQGDAIVLRSQVGATQVQRSQEGWVVLEHNTLLFGQTALRFSGSPQGRNSPVVRVLSTACVFAPAPGAPALEAAVLEHPAEMQRSQLFDWWENRNGYTPALKVFRIAGAGRRTKPEEPQDFHRDWSAFWGTDHVESPYTGVNGVLTATVLTSLTNLAPSSVALNRSCEGATGAPDGGAIGVRTGQIGPLGKTVSPASNPMRPGVPRPPTQNPGNRPDF